jgi:hypothetical protein
MNHNAYSDYETQRLVEMTNARRPAAEIAEVLGRPVQGIYNKLHKLRRDGTLDHSYPTTCTQPGCEEPHACRQLCRRHYNKALYMGLLARREYRWCACGQAARQSGLCLYHEGQQRRRAGRNTTAHPSVAPEPS